MKKIPKDTILLIFIIISILILKEVDVSFITHLGFNLRSIFTIIITITVFTFIVEHSIYELRQGRAKSITESIKKAQDFQWKYSKIMFVTFISFVLFIFGYWGVKEIIELILGTEEFSIMTLILSLIGISLLVLLIVILVEELILKIKGGKKNYFKPWRNR